MLNKTNTKTIKTITNIAILLSVIMITIAYQINEHLKETPITIGISSICLIGAFISTMIVIKTYDILTEEQ